MIRVYHSRHGSRPRKGFSIIEVVVASALLLVLLVSSLLALDSNSKILAVNRAHDTAVAVGYKVLDQMRLFNCGAFTGTDDGTSIAFYPTTNRPGDQTACSEILSAPLPTDSSELPDVDTTFFNLAHSYSGVVDSQSVQSGYAQTADGTATPARDYLVTVDYALDSADSNFNKDSLCTTPTFRTPDIVTYEVNVYWKVRTNWHMETFHATESLPQDFATFERGILVDTSANSSVGYTLVETGFHVDRATREPGCTWFALPSPTIANRNSTQAAVTITDSSTRTITLGQLYDGSNVLPLHLMKKEVN